MAKKVAGFIKLQIEAGKANPAPPIGPALGQHGVNIMEFCKAYNAATQGKEGIMPVEITVYADKSFSYVLKSPPVSALLRKAAGIAKGSGEPNKNKVGTVSREQIKEIAGIKMNDSNAFNIEAMCRSIEGSMRSMGLEVAAE